MRLSFVTALTKRIRASKARSFIGDVAGKRLLDIGCGDGYFMGLFKNIECVGVDKNLGVEVVDALDFPDASFDYVTMLAVIEHLEKPEDVVGECFRVLVDGGFLVLTTPKQSADRFINVVDSEFAEYEGEHHHYFGLEDMGELLGSFFTIKEYKTFLFGFNQIFVCVKK